MTDQLTNLEDAQLIVDLFASKDGPDSDYLVVDKEGQHLRVKRNGTPDHRLMGEAWAALTDPNGFRGNKYEGGDKSAALDKLKKLYKSENMDTPGSTNNSAAGKNRQHADFVMDEFVNTKAGEPFRLLSFGTFTKNGVKHSLTRETALQFKLPHWKPAIKLGSHEEATPAGGHIVGLQVGEDGLYAIPQWTDKGSKAVDEGDFRYHSPEIVWENGAIEDPNTGEFISGPMIVGDALLHNPHLGEGTAFYEYQPHKKETPMTDQNVSVPQSLLNGLMGLVFGPGAGNGEPGKIEPQAALVKREELAAAIKERDELKAKVEAQEKAAAHKAEVDKLTVELQKKERFGVLFADAKVVGEAAEMFSAIPEAQREYFMRKMAALQAVADFNKLGTEFGGTGKTNGGTNAIDSFSALVKATQKDRKVSYAQALTITTNENPDAAAAYNAAMKARAGRGEEAQEE